MRKILLLLALLGLVLLSSCSEPKTFYEGIDEQYITVSVEDKDRYGAQTYVSEDTALTTEEKQKIWDDYMQVKMDQDHYLTMMKIYERQENPFHIQEEDRIEKYCEDEGFGACRTITSTCESEGCHRVKVTCTDPYYLEGDPYDDCNRFDVDVQKEIDDDLTDAERIQECKDNDDDAYISLTCDQM